MRIHRITVLVTAAIAASSAPAAVRAQSRTEAVAMTDGVALSTDVYLPASGSTFPVILVRTPYGKSAVREIATNITAAAPIAVVVQDTRGRFASEGTDCVFRCEQGDGLHDGHDTMAWIAAQDWYRGPIVSYGGSALGIVQYMQAVDALDALAAMWVEVATPTLYDHGMFQGGVFRQAMIEGWLEAQGSTFALDDIRAHALRDDFWDAVQMDDRWDRVDVPAVHWGGWFDIFAQGTIDAFVGYQHHGGPRARGRQKLVMGPWTHGGWGRPQQGELTFPAQSLDAAEPSMVLRWLAHYTGASPDDAWIASLPAVQYYVMGDVDDPAAPGNEWRTADDWPIAAAPTRWHLGTGGALAERCPPDDGGATAWMYDPRDPTPTLGGANLVLPAGPFDQRPIESRGDVAVFTSEPLTAPIEVTGRVRAHLFVSADVVDTDVMVRLTDVYPDGRSMLVLDGALRLATRNGTDRLELLEPGAVVEAEVDLWSTSIVFASGHRIRVSLASANAPRFFPSRNDGSTYGEDGTPTLARVSVVHERARASYLELPVPGRDAADFVVCGSPRSDPDAGAGAVDASAASSPSAASSKHAGGCGCRAVPSRSHLPPLFALALLAVAARGRRGAPSRHRPDR